MLQLVLGHLLTPGKKDFFLKFCQSMDTVMVREQISYSKLQKYQLSNLVLTTDLGLLIKTPNREKHGTPEKFILGFTIRNWLEERRQIFLKTVF